MPPHQQCLQSPRELVGYSMKLFLFSICPKAAKTQSDDDCHLSSLPAPGPRAWPSAPLLPGCWALSPARPAAEDRPAPGPGSHSWELAPRLGLSAAWPLGTVLGTGPQDSALLQEGPIPGAGSRLRRDGLSNPVHLSLRLTLARWPPSMSPLSERPSPGRVWLHEHIDSEKLFHPHCGS